MSVIATDWKALSLDYGIGQNAFTACPPRSTAPDSHAAPKKRGPKKHSLTLEQRNAAVTAYKPSAHSCNYAAVPTPAKTIGVASSHFATA